VSGLRSLVSGANGFVGRALCAELVKRGLRVRGATREACLLDYAVENIAVGDIDGYTDWRDALCDIDVVIHLAARVHIMRENATDPYAEFRRVNVEGTENLVQQAAACGVKRLVYISSIKVNGEETVKGSVCRETDPPAPQDAYGISKNETEIRLRALTQATGLEVVIIRPPLVYGPGVKGNFASMVRWVQRGFPLPLGAVHNARSMIALENLIDFIVMCADREKSPSAANETFLVSDGEEVSTTELLRKVASAYGIPVRLIPVPVNILRLGAKMMGRSEIAERLLGSLVVDSSKAQNLLGWRPVVTMDEQLRKMAQYAKSV
jgi:nucleoside-diphosphate-sugar epimerase